MNDTKQTSSNMRKYTKLSFCILFFICAIGLVFYRTEYLRLRYTFEVGGLLDPPDLPTNCLVLNNTVRNRNNEFNLFSKPNHVWSAVDDFFIYSAFMKVEDDVKIAVLLGVSETDKDCSEYKCQVWYSFRGITTSYNGVLNCASSAVPNSSRFLLEFFCKVEDKETKGNRHMFVLIDQTSRMHLIPLPRKSKSESAGKSALCIFPDQTGVEQQSIIELLSYNILIGFTDVIVYDDFSHHSILNSLDQVFQNSALLRSFSVRTWNFPFSDILLSREAIKKDCLYRTSGQVELVTSLSWDEYLIPVQRNSILKMSNLFLDHNTNVLLVQKRRCCIDGKDEKKSDKSWPLIFKKTLCINQPGNVSLTLNIRPNLETAKSVALSPSDMLVFQYGICGENISHHIRDTTTLKFLTTLVESKLLALWRSGTMTD